MDAILIVDMAQFLAAVVLSLGAVRLKVGNNVLVVLDFDCFTCYQVVLQVGTIFELNLHYVP